jgi:hypothetical protein
MKTNTPATLDNLRNVPAAFTGRRVSGMLDAARSGVQSSFAVVGYKGKNWRLKYRGEENLVRDGQGRPMNDLEVVIVGIAPNVAKTFYAKAYADGDDNAPDCFSLDGISPDSNAPKKQNPTCGNCPNNQWGSRITDNGKRAKACADSRRIAVVPRGDIENESYGGPMLLRIPATSLPNLAGYADFLTRKGADVPWVGTKLSFDYDVAYPKLVFETTGFLSDAEAQAVLEAMENPLIERMLHDAGPTESAPAATAGADEIPGRPPAAMTGGVVTPLRRGAGLAAGTPQTPVEEPGQAPPVEEPEEEQEEAPPPPPPAAGRANPFATATQQQQVVAQQSKPNGAAKPARRTASAVTVPEKAPADLESAIDDLLSDLA